ncbi:MAG: T9SS type A sorting domain-containing protein [bacterium]
MLQIKISIIQNYPNPFNPSTTIKYSIPHSNIVTLKVYDVLGKEVANLVNEYKNAGSYEVNFDGSKLSSGTYFYQLKAGQFTETKKLLLLK